MLDYKQLLLLVNCWLHSVHSYMDLIDHRSSEIWILVIVGCLETQCGSCATFFIIPVPEWLGDNNHQYWLNMVKQLVAGGLIDVC